MGYVCEFFESISSPLLQCGSGRRHRTNQSPNVLVIAFSIQSFLRPCIRLLSTLFIDVFSDCSPRIYVVGLDDTMGGSRGILEVVKAAEDAMSFRRLTPTQPLIGTVLDPARHREHNKVAG